ncbi:MAG: diguanylate cyclase [Thiohalophilus sp.]|uniref:diguanylate cyclase domain-containing protein n=1 Tax=Thiohalophilus sp. TaxID=3028392 RepID=UPI00286FEA49|nr:diguanylate cyclase [Thiohalophilus sp.]MDR9435500.1 diguanylate cyclase [Thiohalophilus sp.]
MQFTRLSIKTSLVLTILLVGLLGLGLALTSTTVYRDVILDYKRQSLSELLAVKTADQLDKLEEQAMEMGNSLKTSPRFREALDRQDTATLSAALRQQFHQYFVTAHVLRLERLIVRSTDYELITSASSRKTALTGDGSACPSLAHEAALRQGAKRLKIISKLCNNNGMPYFSLLLPVGGLVPKGYLEIITSPTLSLKPIENDLAIPLCIRLPDEEILYSSNQWPDNRENGLTARYALSTSDGSNTALFIEAYEDTQEMSAELVRTRNTLLLSSAILIALVIFFALALLRRTLVRPLEILNHKLQLLHNDNSSLGEPIHAPSNIIEVNQLVDDFNKMSAELHDLYGRLERMAYTDSMTRLPNRGLFNDYVDHLLAKYNDTGQHFALLLIDLDEFKQVNDEYGHEAGDMLLCETASRMNSVLRTPSMSGQNGFSLAEIADRDLLVRLGGDEFAAIIPAFDNSQQVEEVARKLAEITRQPVQLYNTPLTIHLSIGIALYPADGSGRTSLLRHADSAMYHAKNHGRDYCFYDHTMNDNRTSAHPETSPTQD